MIQAITSKIITGFSVVALALASLWAISAFTHTASAQDIQDQVRCGSNISLSGDGCDTDVSGGATGIENIIKAVINVFSAIVGSVAVIMIVIGGFRYITSGGDSTSVGGAKNTIIYAIVGLIIVAIAQIIVKFVLERTTS